MNPTADPREQRWLQEIASGNRASFEQLYAHHGQRLYAYAYRRMGNEAEANDVLQESLLAVWVGAKRYRGEGRVLAWLLKIVHNQSMRALRGRSHSPLSEVENLADPAPLPADNLEHRMLAEGLNRLSLEHRSALELIFFHGLSLQEAAEVCHCPLGTLKSRLSYAKKALHGELTRSGFYEDTE